MTDTIVLAGSTARGVRRLARRSEGLHLEPTDMRTVSSLGRRYVTESSLGLASLRTALGLGPTRNIELLVPAPKDRIRARGLACHVMSRPLPQESFMRVTCDGGPLAAVVPNGLEMLVESPSLSFLGAAAQLDRLVRSGNMSETEADARLLRLAVEECSTYALDPRDPLAGACIFDVAPLLASSQLSAYLAEARSFPGLTAAQRVAGWVFDGSASPMETFLNAALSLPAARGCFELPVPLANHTICLDEFQRTILNHLDHITPDLLWLAYKIILEYLGKEPHEGGAAQDEDMSRIQDYEVLGYRVLPVRYRHVKSPGAFNKLVLRLAQLMGCKGSFNAPAWVNELLQDRKFLALQRIFFATMLPPVEQC